MHTDAIPPRQALGELPKRRTAALRCPTHRHTVAPCTRRASAESLCALHFKLAGLGIALVRVGRVAGVDAPAARSARGSGT